MVLSSHPWLQRAVLTIGVAALAPTGAHLAAETRKVSGESLIYDLKNPDALRRQEAARALGAARFQPATPHLVAMTRDPVPAVRREVEMSLELMNNSDALPGFIAFSTDTEDDIRGRAVAAVINLHLPRASGLGAALTKLNDLVRLASDSDMSIVVDPDVPVSTEVVETLRGRVVDPERGIRRTAIRGLGILRAGPAVPDLLQVVREDRSDGLRFEAARSLHKIGDASIADQLLALLNVSSDPVRNELITTIGSMRYRGAVSELTRIVEQSPKPDAACVRALAALADIADPSSAALFERMRYDQNEKLRLYANEGIARTAGASAQTVISSDRLTERSARVRAAQSFALLRLGQPEYLDELIRGLDAPATRELAQEYLIETQPRDRPALFAPRTVNGTTRAELAEVMGLMADPGALPTLQDMARDTDKDVARAAQKAMRRITLTTGESPDPSSARLRE